MSAVQIERGPNGYAVTRYFRNLPAALAAAERVLAVCEAAFEPVPEVGAIMPDPGAVKLAVAIERAEADDPAPHDGRNPVTADEE